MVGYKDDAIAVVNPDGERTCSIPLQLFASRPRKAPDDSQIFSSIEIVQALPDLLPALFSEALS